MSCSDNFDECIEQKIFHVEIVVDSEKVSAETKAYKKIPQILSFTDENGNDNMKQNYRQVKADVVHIVESEMERIKIDPEFTAFSTTGIKERKAFFIANTLLRKYRNTSYFVIWQIIIQTI